MFQLRSDDYRGWAKGLQTAGYATNKGYANKLIQVIETYELYTLDKGEAPRWLKGESSHSTHSKHKPSAPKTSKDVFARRIYMSYGLYYVLADPGDSLERIAEETGLSVRKLARYNDAPEDIRLQEGDVVYLERKHKRAVEPYRVHTVAIGDSMHSISQRYGIRLENLYKMNDKDEDYVPEEGDVLRLQ